MTAILDKQMEGRQFGTAIDSLQDALRDCPEELWERQLWEDEPGQRVAAGFSAFWYLGYHTLFWRDLYLTGAEEGLAPPAPFDLVEMQEGKVVPRTYARQELLGYLEDCRRKCQTATDALSVELACRLCRFAWGGAVRGAAALHDAPRAGAQCAAADVPGAAGAQAGPRRIPGSGTASRPICTPR